MRGRGQVARPTRRLRLLIDPAIQPGGGDDGNREREQRHPQLGHEADEEARDRTCGSDRDPVPHPRELGERKRKARAGNRGCKFRKQRESDDVWPPTRLGRARWSHLLAPECKYLGADGPGTSVAQPWIGRPPSGDRRDHGPHRQQSRDGDDHEQERLQVLRAARKLELDDLHGADRHGLGQRKEGPTTRDERYGQDAEHEVLDRHVRRAQQGEDHADRDRGDRLTSQEVATPEQQDGGNPPEAACRDEPDLAASGGGRDERRNADTPV